MKEFLKSTNIWKRNRQKSVDTFLAPFMTHNVVSYH